MTLKSLIIFIVVELLSLLQPLQAQTQNYEFIASSRSLMRAGSGQTLSMLVQEIYPGYKKLWPQIEQEIRRRNPQAFNQYSGNIIPGRRIQLIAIKTVHESYLLHKTVVGRVVQIKGMVQATDARGSTQILSKNSEVFEGDRITTALGATTRLDMVDDAVIDLKSDSSLRLTAYRLKSGFEKGSRSIIDLIKGGLRTLTGAIAANPVADYRFHTGIMTIGVRGTDYVVKLCEKNDCEHSASRNDQNARLHVAVLDGLIYLEDSDGQRGDLIMGQYAIASNDEKVIVNDAKPAAGLLNAQEQKRFSQLTPPEKDKSRVWPWLLGGAALLGL